MKNFTFSKYCTPAYLNVALGVTIIIGTFLAGLKTETLALEALFIGVWALGLQWLCSKGYKIISWSLAVVPVIAALYMVILVKNDVAAKEGIDNKTTGTAGDNISKTPGGDNTKDKRDAISNLKTLLDNAIRARFYEDSYIKSYNNAVPFAAKKRAIAEKATNDAGDAYAAIKEKAYAASNAVNANPKSDRAKINSGLAPYWRKADGTYKAANAAITEYQYVQNNTNNALAKSNNAINAAKAAEDAYKSAESDFKSKYPDDYKSIAAQAVAAFNTPIAEITQKDVSGTVLRVDPPDVIRNNIYPGKTKR